MNQVYPARSKTWNLERAKVPGIDDRKSVHFSNIDRLTIVDPRELSRCSKSKFLTARGISCVFSVFALYLNPEFIEFARREQFAKKVSLFKRDVGRLEKVVKTRISINRSERDLKSGIEEVSLIVFFHRLFLEEEVDELVGELFLFARIGNAKMFYRDECPFIGEQKVDGGKAQHRCADIRAG